MDFNLSCCYLNYFLKVLIFTFLRDFIFTYLLRLFKFEIVRELLIQEKNKTILKHNSNILIYTYFALHLLKMLCCAVVMVCGVYNTP